MITEKSSFIKLSGCQLETYKFGEQNLDFIFEFIGLDGTRVLEPEDSEFGKVERFTYLGSGIVRASDKHVTVRLGRMPQPDHIKAVNLILHYLGTGAQVINTEEAGWVLAKTLYDSLEGPRRWTRPRPVCYFEDNFGFTAAAPSDRFVTVARDSHGVMLT